MFHLIWYILVGLIAGVILSGFFLEEQLPGAEVWL